MVSLDLIRATTRFIFSSHDFTVINNSSFTYSLKSISNPKISINPTIFDLWLPISSPIETHSYKNINFKTQLKKIRTCKLVEKTEILSKNYSFAYIISADYKLFISITCIQFQLKRERGWNSMTKAHNSYLHRLALLNHWYANWIWFRFLSHLFLLEDPSSSLSPYMFCAPTTTRTLCYSLESNHRINVCHHSSFQNSNSQ